MNNNNNNNMPMFPNQFLFGMFYLQAQTGCQTITRQTLGEI